MPSRIVRPELTVAQTHALLSAVGFAEAGEPEGWDPAVLDRAGTRLARALYGSSGDLPPDEPQRGFGVATVAAWLTEHNTAQGKPEVKVKPRDVTDWLYRYGPDREPERLAVSPPYPEPDVEVEAEGGRMIKGWSLAKREPWETWYDSRPGRGAGGGRPRLDGLARRNQRGRTPQPHSRRPERKAQMSVATQCPSCGSGFRGIPPVDTACLPGMRDRTIRIRPGRDRQEHGRGHRGRRNGPGNGSRRSPGPRVCALPRQKRDLRAQAAGSQRPVGDGRLPGGKPAGGVDDPLAEAGQIPVSGQAGERSAATSA